MGKEIKKNKESKSEKLIKKGAGVPFKRPWQKRRPVKCKQIRPFFGILKFGKNLLKPRDLSVISGHIRVCDVCKTIGGNVLFKF